MPRIKENTRYDPDDKESILRFAGELTETTLREWVLPTDRRKFKGKGQFGQILEEGVFYIETNSESKPDFEDVGVELKTTPIKRLKGGGLVPKERLSLSTINYMTLLEEGWDGSFWNKNHELLIIFYLYEKGRSICDLRILGHVLWSYPEEDLLIIRKDWETIAQKVKEGRAHEISERDTAYLSASRKGAGGSKDNRKQPFSIELAPQRAFALKPSYVNSIWRRAHTGERIFDDTGGSLEKTIEEEVLSRFSRFKGMRVEDIKDILDPTLNTSSKAYYEQVARRMLGVKGRRIEEFEKADIKMKIVRLQKNGMPKESMSFPAFDYIEEVGLDWEESDLYNMLRYRRFLFVVYRTHKDGTFFEGATFWSMPHSDFVEAERVWRTTVERIKEGRMEDLPRISESPVAHVRPHAKDSSDTKAAPDGGYHIKRCFWLNASYIGRQLKGKGF